MKQRIDNLVVGIVLGMLLPVLGGLLYFKLTWGQGMSLKALFVNNDFHGLLVKSLSLAVYFTNLPLFFLFIWQEINKAARGVLFATVLYTIWVMYEKFLA